MSLDQLDQLARANTTDRGLLAEIRAQFLRLSQPHRAQAITQLIQALSPGPSARPGGAKPLLTADSKMPELLAYFRRHAFHDPEALEALLEVLDQREGPASQNLADEVLARLRQLKPVSQPATVAKSPVQPTAPSRQPASFTKSLRPATPRSTSEPSPRSPFDTGFKPVSAIEKTDVPLIGNAAWLAERRKARERRKQEGARPRSSGFIEIKAQPTRQMIEVYLGSPEHLIATVAKMKRGATKMRAYQGVTEAELAKAMERLQHKSWRDEAERRRDRRLIPYLLLAGSPAYVSRFGLAPFVTELNQDDRLTPLKEMIQRYFHADFQHYPKQRVALGAWITEKLEQIDKAKCKRAWVHHYLHHKALFSADPVGFAASFLPPKQPDWSLWEDLDLPTHSWLYGDALAEGVRMATRNADHRLLGDLYSRLQRTVATDVTGSNTRVVREPVESLEVRRKCIEAALLEHVRLKTISPEPTLIAFALDTLKDPRQKDSAHWYGVAQEARALMEAWLSIEDLELFFGELADDSDEKSRVQYWKPFVLNRLVSSSRIFLGEGVIRRKRKKVEKYLHSGRYGRLTGPSSDEVCAFVLRIKDAIVVEFSKVNNACFVYNAKRYDPNLMGAKAVAIGDLKNTGGAQKLSHVANWPSRFDEFLFREYGIRRPKS